MQRVTEDNKSRKITSISRVINVPKNLRYTLAQCLRIPFKSKFVKCILISNVGSKDKKLVRFSKIFDRCLQVLVKLVLEPEWRAKFTYNPHRLQLDKSCCGTTKKAISNFLKYNETYVIRSNISNCFDEIDYPKILSRTGLHGKLYKQIKYWLENGIMTSLNWRNIEFLDKKSIPQDSVLSSLLANIALCGLETKIKKFVFTKEVEYLISQKRIEDRRIETVMIARYAGDFIILHNNLKIIMGCFSILNDFFENSGLKISENKIFLAHSKYNLKENIKPAITLSNIPGFDFLGFNFRHYQSKYFSIKKTNGKLLVLPSKESIKKHNTQMHEEILKKGKTKSQEQLINQLNPIIVKWVNYFGISDAKTFGILNKLDYLLYLKLRKWSKVGKKVSEKHVCKLWRKLPDTQGWIFCSPPTKLLKYSKILNNGSFLTIF